MYGNFDSKENTELSSILLSFGGSLTCKIGIAVCYVWINKIYIWIHLSLCSRSDIMEKCKIISHCHGGRMPGTILAL